MHRETINSATVEQGNGWTRRWLAAAELCGARHGAVAAIEVEPGGALPVSAGIETALICLSGALRWDGAEAAALEQGERTLAYIPRDGDSVVRASNNGQSVARAVVLYGGESSMERIARANDSQRGPDARVRLIRVADVEADPSLSAGAGWHGLRVRWLASQETVGAAALTMNWTMFEADGGHELHKHDHAEEAIFLVDGSVEQLSVDGAVTLEPGDCTFVASQEWHGHRAAGGGATVIGCYLGAGSVDLAGYDEYRP